MWINILRMPSDYCIFRVATAEECHAWMDAFRKATYGPHPGWNVAVADPEGNFSDRETDVDAGTSPGVHQRHGSVDHDSE